ncbi:UNVERIFIED_CONTAM: hypothetical protein HDU68_012735 [Siphonaria sp. JEL0065]|nr:hypothetical protein HDU68_012735 [Siphonaria sp. JEL0065]
MSIPSHSECISITTTSLCAPWTTGLYINTTALAAQYNVGALYLSDWEAYLGRYSPAKDLGCQTQTLQSDWNQPATKTQFLTTYLCMRDVLVLSAGCNDAMGAKTPSPALCSDTCSFIGQGFKDYLSNAQQCPSVDKNSAFASARSSALAVASDCQTVVKAWQKDVGSNDNNCLASAVLDYSSCGLGGNSIAAEAFCKSNGYTPKCCSSFIPPGFTLSSTTAAAIPTKTVEPDQNASSSGLSAGAIAGIVIACIAGLAVIIVGAILFAKRTFNNKSHGANKVSSSTTAIGARKSTVQSLRSYIPYAPLGKESDSYSLPRIPATSPFPSQLRLDVDIEAKTSPLGEQTVQVDHIAQRPDELSLRIGELVVVTNVHDDGWCSGTRTKRDGSAEAGVFPLLCIGF